MRNAIRATALALMLEPLAAQSTNGLLAGRVVDSATGAAIPGAVVSYRTGSTGAAGRTNASASGHYVLPALPPDIYQVRAAADGYQAQEVFELELNVAGRLELDFRLRPLADVFGSDEPRQAALPGSAALVRFFGPDVDMSRTQFIPALRATQGLLESSVSEVIHPRDIRDLPLAGRDVYTLLATQAGVTADSATARGLGLAANGQRPSSSNFLLDGVENNNYLITGPLTAITPEAVQEYRFSSNNFSAEYGGTSGFLANAATRAGGPHWHGIGYFYGKHSALNANTFQQNRLGIAKAPFRERQPGFHIGGPVRRERLFISSALEDFRSRGFSGEQEYLFPAAGLLTYTEPGSASRKLLERFAPPVPGKPNELYASGRLRTPNPVDRLLLLERGDWLLRGGLHRFLARVSLSRLSQPDFIWSPYPDFVSGSTQQSLSVMVGASNMFTPNLAGEGRIAFARDRLSWDRPHPEIPALLSSDGAWLPGSYAFYGYRNRTSSWELRENLTWFGGAHIVKFGGNALLRGSAVRHPIGQEGIYVFETVLDFAFDEPDTFDAAIARGGSGLAQPEPNRRYRQTQFAGFVQDTWRLTQRLALNLGLRYESYGHPVSTGATKDFTIAPSSGDTFRQRLAGAGFAPPPSGDQSINPADRNDWAGRFGLGYSLGRGAVLRAAYGIFYDRLFDNAWQNVRGNSVQLAHFILPGGSWDFLEGPPASLRKLAGTRYSSNAPSPVFLQPGLRTAYAHSFFAGWQQRLHGNWSVEVNGAGSAGRKLVTTDIVNRNVTLTSPRMISYLSNQGLSNYRALTVSTSYRPARGLLHAAYTWSSLIDIQSEPLAGEFFDLSFTRATEARSTGVAAFSRELDSRGDRALSNFDQRHNLVVYSVWDLPGRLLPLRNWKVAQMAAFRSGFPLTVLAASQVGPDGEFLLNTRAQAVSGAEALASGEVPGGRQWLNARAFVPPAPGLQGNTARNGFRGPGLFNIDVSLARSFALRPLGETGRLTLRLDAFNFLNHANLNNPDTRLRSSGFGVAFRGRTGREGGFPSLVPFTETARQLQVMLRVEF